MKKIRLCRCRPNAFRIGSDLAGRGQSGDGPRREARIRRQHDDYDVPYDRSRDGPEKLTGTGLAPAPCNSYATPTDTTMHAVDFYNCANGIAGVNGGEPYCRTWRRSPRPASTLLSANNQFDRSSLFFFPSSRLL